MKRSRVLILSLSLACLSCSTYVPVQKVIAPEIVVSDNGGGRFIFLSSFYPDSLPIKNDNKVEVFQMSHDSFINGLQAGFDTSRYQLTRSDTIMGRVAHTAPNLDHTVDSLLIQKLCRENQANYLLMLDAFNLWFSQDMDVVKNEDGTKSRTAYYDLVLATYISLFNSQGTLLDRFNDELRIEHDKRSVLSGFLAVGPSMGKADKNALIISDELGRNFIQKLYPSNTEELREFFNTKEFKPAYQAFIAEDWKRAEHELMRLTESTSAETAGRAAHNLGVLCEHLQRFDEMTYWYEKARTDLGKKAPQKLGSWVYQD